MKLIDLTKIGFSLKPHGTEGQIRINVEDSLLDILMEARAVFIDLDGSKVPFLIDSVEVKNHILLKLDEIDTPEAAQQLSQSELYLEKNLVPEELMNQDSSGDLDWLKTYKVVNQDNKVIGTIQEVVYNAYQTLLKIESGNDHILWPYHKDFIIEIDQENTTLILELLEGFDEL